MPGALSPRTHESEFQRTAARSLYYYFVRRMLTFRMPDANIQFLFSLFSLVIQMEDALSSNKRLPLQLFYKGKCH